MPTIAALLFLQQEWPADSDLRYPLSLAIIGLSFTLAQFLFQVLESRYNSNKEVILIAFRDLVNMLSDGLENLNSKLGNKHQTTMIEIMNAHIHFSNGLRQEFGSYLPAVLNGFENLKEFNDFVLTLDKMDDVVEKYAGSFSKLQTLTIAECEKQDYRFEGFTSEYNELLVNLAFERSVLLDAMRLKYFTT